MKLTQLTSGFFPAIDEETGLRMIKTAGYDNYDYTMCGAMDNPNHPIGTKDWESHAKKLRKLSDSLNLPCTQAHAVFPTLCDGEEFLNKRMPLIERGIEVAGILGCKHIVVHPGNDFSAKDNAERMYNLLLKKAKECDVVLATENMWNWVGNDAVPPTVPAACGTGEDFVAHVDAVNSPYLCACLDLGHAEMKPAPGAVEMIKALGKDRLKCIHLHDNDLLHDDHALPYLGKVNWREVMTALREIDYQGDLTFECSFISKFPPELRQDALIFQEKVGRYLIELFNGTK